MMTENGGLALSPRATALTSVSLMGGRSVTVGLAAIGLYGGSATGDSPAAGTGLLCCTVAAAGAGCEFVASSVAPFLQNLVDNVGLSRYVR